MPKGQANRVPCSGPCEGEARDDAMPGYWWCRGCWGGVPQNLRDWWRAGQKAGNGRVCLQAKAVIDDHLRVQMDVARNP